MRIKSIRIQHLRAFEDETIELDACTLLVGPNGAGKSTILTALNIFFRESADSATNLVALERDDFHGGLTTAPIRITVTFSGLSEQAQQDFAQYYRQGELTVTAEARFDETTGRADVMQYGERRVMRAFQPFFEADKEAAKVAALRAIYGELRAQYEDLPAPGTKAQMTEALRTYEERHPDLTEPLPSEDQFYGFSRGANRLARYVQWVFVPAVKDASAEQLESRDTALGRLLARTVRARVSFRPPLDRIRQAAREQYEQVLREQQGALDTVSRSLQSRVQMLTQGQVRLSVKWDRDSERSVRVEEPFARVALGDAWFVGSPARCGHGLQRVYLLALLQEMPPSGDEGEPTLLLAIEEPELYQHPPQCRHMAAILGQLSTGNAQVLITTHSPYFVSGEAFHEVRLVRKDDAASCAVVKQASVENVAQIVAGARDGMGWAAPQGALAKVHQMLQPTLSEMFFTPFLILTEGREDIAYIVTYLTLLGHQGKLQRVGCHFVPTEGKGKLVWPLATAKHLGIPSLVIFDADGHRPDKNGSREQHRVDNTAILRLAGIANPDPFPPDNVWSPSVVMWRSEIGEVVKGDFGQEPWLDIKEQVALRYGHVGGLEKNPLYVADVVHAAWDCGLRSDNLGRLSEHILAFCNLA